MTRKELKKIKRINSRVAKKAINSEIGNLLRRKKLEVKILLFANVLTICYIIIGIIK